MAVGDVITVAAQTVTAGSTYDIKPAGTAEWVIHNIYVDGPFDLIRQDGTVSIDVDSLTGAGAWVKQDFHVNTTSWLQVKNTDSVSRHITFDGVVTHV